MGINKYLLSYLIGVIFGTTELLMHNNKNKNKNKNYYCNEHVGVTCFVSAAFFNTYGIALVCMTLFLDVARTLNIPFCAKLLFLTIILIIVECVSGKFSKYVHEHRMWHYSKNLIPFCDGFISVATTFYFMLLSVIYMIFVYPNLNNMVRYLDRINVPLDKVK